MFSGSSSSEARLLLGFQALSALFSLTSSLRDTVAMILRGSFLWLCWERRGPNPEGWHRENKLSSLLWDIQASSQGVPICLLRSSALSQTSVAQTQRLKGLIITERWRGRARVKRGNTHQAPVAHDGPAKVGEGGGEVGAAVHATEADGVKRPQWGLVGLQRYTGLRMPRGQRSGMDPSPSLSAGTRNSKEGLRGAPTNQPQAQGLLQMPQQDPDHSRQVPALPCQGTKGSRPPSGHHPHFPYFQGRTNLVQHHVCDLGQPLRFLHAGKDELEPQQELPVIALLLLRVQWLPLLCSGEKEALTWPVPYLPC